MSVRLEWATAQAVRPTLYRKGDVLADGNRVTEPLAIAIGTQVIEGDREQLVDIVAEIGLLLHPELGTSGG